MVTTIEVIRQNVFSHAIVLDIGVGCNLKSTNCKVNLRLF